MVTGWRIILSEVSVTPGIIRENSILDLKSGNPWLKTPNRNNWIENFTTRIHNNISNK